MKKYGVFIIFAMLIFAQPSFSDESLNKQNITEKQIQTVDSLIKSYKKTRNYNDRITYANKILEIYENKKDKDEQDMFSIASIRLMIADDERKILNLKEAAYYYESVYEILKESNMNMNNEMAIYCISNLISISAILQNDEEKYKKYTKEYFKIQSKMTDMPNLLI